MRSQPTAGRRGAALVELALFTPVLLYMLVAVGDFGRYYVESSQLAEVAQAAARREAEAASRGENPSGPPGAEIRIETFCACPEESSERFACSAKTCSGVYGEPARYVLATAEKPFSFIARYPGFPSELTMRSRAAVRLR